MRDRRNGGASSESSSSGAEGGAPGKRTRTEQIMRRASSSGGPAAGAESALAAAGHEGGHAPDAGLRAGVERATGADLSGVRVHTGSSSADAAASVQAKAYTVGQDVHFGAGQYAPGSRDGDHLIAHELAHAAQQGASPGPAQFKLEVSQPGDAAEVQADAIADAVVAGDATHQGVMSTGLAVQREAQSGGSKPKPETEKVEGTIWALDENGKPLPPSIEDVRQGGVNDCFVFAAMAAIVHSDPDRIKGMIKDNGDGSYTVTFHGTGFFSSHQQTVTADFEKGKHGNVNPSRKAIWPLIIEKAYAKEKGGLQAFDDGGNAGTAVDDMVNMGASRFNPQDKDAAWILAKVAKAQKEKKPTTFLSPAEKEAGDKKKQMSKDIPGLHFWHFYAVHGVDEKDRKVKLYNPWGYDHPNGDGWLGIDDVKKFFIECDISG